MVEGLDVTIEDKYLILRDADFLREYGPAASVARLLESNLNKGNSVRTRRDLEDLGIKVAELEVVGSVKEYLERLRQGDEAVRAHYGALARICRKL